MPDVLKSKEQMLEAIWVLEQAARQAPTHKIAMMNMAAADALNWALGAGEESIFAQMLAAARQMLARQRHARN